MGPHISRGVLRELGRSGACPSISAVRPGLVREANRAKAKRLLNVLLFPEDDAFVELVSCPTCPLGHFWSLVSTTGASVGRMNPGLSWPRGSREQLAAHTNPAVAGGCGLLRGPALGKDERLCAVCPNQGLWVLLWALLVPLHVWPLPLLNLFQSSFQPQLSLLSLQ